MAQQENQQTFVPIFVSQDEYNEIMKQPAYMHQQLLQQLYQKQSQQSQQPIYQQQPQYQPYQPSQHHQPIQIPPIPNQPEYGRPPQLNYQPQMYTPQQQMYQQLIPPVEQITYNHKLIQKAGHNEIKLFNEEFTSYIALQNGLALLLNFFSMIFGFKIVTSWYELSAGFWIVLSLFIALNLFVLTSPRFVARGKNQQVLFIIHTALYMLMMQGLQTFVSGYQSYYYGEINYFFYFYAAITSQMVAVAGIVKKQGVQTESKKYLFYLIVPVAIIFVIHISTYYRYFYVPFFIWCFVVVFLGVGEIHLVRKINSAGYNNYRTCDAQAMAMNIPILIISPINDLG